MNAKEALMILHDTKLTESAAMAMAVDALRENVQREEAAAPRKPTLEEQLGSLASLNTCSDLECPCSESSRCPRISAAADTLRRLREVGQRAVNAMQPNVRFGRVTSYTGGIGETIELLQLLVDCGLREKR